MATRNATYNSVGPFPYDDTVYYAVNTDGQMYVGAAPTIDQNIIRLADLTDRVGNNLPLSVAVASVVGVATKFSREDHVHSDANILGTALPVSVATTGVVGTGTRLSREDHVHSGVDLSSAQTITARKTFQTDVLSPLVIGGVGAGSSLILKSTEGVGTTDAIIFQVGNNGAVEGGRVVSSGRVGFGTSTPGVGSASQVEISQATSGNTGLRIRTPSAKTAVVSEYPMYLTTSEAWASNPFALEVSIRGEAAIANRSVRLQTMDINLANDGQLIFQLSGGVVGIGVVPGAGKSRLFFGGTQITTADVALDAGWGANAVVSAVSGTDTRGKITVTTSVLDTPLAAPTLTLTFKDGTWTGVPFAIVVMDDTGSGPLGALSCHCTATTLVIIYNGTPTALSAVTYIFNYHVLG